MCDNHIEDMLNLIKEELEDINIRIQNTNESVNDIRLVVLKWYKESNLLSTNSFIYEKLPKYYIKSLNECDLNGNYIFKGFNKNDFSDIEFEIFEGGDVLSFFANLKNGTRVVIDTNFIIQNSQISNSLISLLKDNKINVVIGKGKKVRTISLNPPLIKMCFIGDCSLLPEDIQELLDGVYIKTE